MLDELRQHRIAANVAFRAGVQDFRIEFADDKAKVQIAVDDRRDVFATNFTAVTFVALGHESRSLTLRVEHSIKISLK